MSHSLQNISLSTRGGNEIGRGQLATVVARVEKDFFHSNIFSLAQSLMRQTELFLLICIIDLLEHRWIEMFYLSGVEVDEGKVH